MTGAVLLGLGGQVSAECTVVDGVGTLCDEGGVVTAEGYDDNGLGPLSGFVQVDTNNGSACADDNGNTEESESPTCV